MATLALAGDLDVAPTIQAAEVAAPSPLALEKVSLRYGGIEVSTLLKPTCSKAGACACRSGPRP